MNFFRTTKLFYGGNMLSYCKVKNFFDVLFVVFEYIVCAYKGYGKQIIHKERIINPINW